MVASITRSSSRHAVWPVSPVTTSRRPSPSLTRTRAVSLRRKSWSKIHTCCCTSITREGLLCFTHHTVRFVDEMIWHRDFQLIKNRLLHLLSYDKNINSVVKCLKLLILLFLLYSKLSNKLCMCFKTIGLSLDITSASVEKMIRCAIRLHMKVWRVSQPMGSWRPWTNHHLCSRSGCSCRTSRQVHAHCPTPRPRLSSRPVTPTVTARSALMVSSLRCRDIV